MSESYKNKIIHCTWETKNIDLNIMMTLAKARQEENIYMSTDLGNCRKYPCGRVYIHTGPRLGYTQLTLSIISLKNIKDGGSTSSNSFRRMREKNLI